MLTVGLDGFGGLAPIFNERKLPEGAAVVAENVRLDGGDLRAWRVPSSHEALAGPGLGVMRLYRFTAADGTRRWLAWNQSLNTVHVAPSPVPQDAHTRLYWTELGKPMKVASNPTLSMVQGNTPGVRQLGIPAPISKPSVVTVADQASLGLHPLSITQAAPAVVRFAAHNFTEGQQVRIVITSDEGNMNEISNKEFLVANPTAETIELRGSDTTNFSAFTNSAAALIDPVYSDSDLESRSYVNTLVSDWGEEGPPSPASDVVDVRTEDGVVKVRLEWARPNGFDHIVKTRLYRTLSGDDGTRFFFVKEVALVGGGPSIPVIVEFDDDVKPIKIGELMPSQEWVAPVSGMHSLISMPNGFFLGFKGRDVFPCEAYQPHAWPDRYRKSMDYSMIGAASIGQACVIATDGIPYLATGTDPASLSLEKIELDAPCMNGGAVVSIGTAVAYPTTDGLAVVAPGNARIVTQSTMTKDQWRALWDPAKLMEAIFHDGKYMVVSRNGAYPSFYVRLTDAGAQIVMMPMLLGTAPARDTQDDSLYYVTNSSGFRILAKFEGGLSKQAYKWHSKLFTMDHPINFSCIQVFADSYPVSLEIRATFYETGNANATPVAFPVITGSNPVRLPSGFASREWRIVVEGTADIQSITMATSMRELSDQ